RCRPVVAVLVVARHPGGLVAVVEGDGRVENDRGRGVAVIDRRGIDERLEARPRLAARLDGPIELAAPEVVSADHRLHLAGVRIDGDDRALDLRLLVEGEAGRLVRT